MLASYNLFSVCINEHANKESVINQVDSLLVTIYFYRME